MNSGNSISAGHRVSEKSKAQKSSESRQKKKLKVAAKVQAAKDLEQNNSVLRDVLVAQSNEILEQRFVIKDRSEKADSLQSVASALGDRVQRLQTELADESAARQRSEKRAAVAEHQLANLKRSCRGATKTKLNEYLTSLTNANGDVPRSPPSTARNPE
jgi:predicted O-linked N-acetylglucosamine transferase (SPINDLY family)